MTAEQRQPVEVPADPERAEGWILWGLLWPIGGEPCEGCGAPVKTARRHSDGQPVAFVRCMGGLSAVAQKCGFEVHSAARCRAQRDGDVAAARRPLDQETIVALAGMPYEADEAGRLRPHRESWLRVPATDRAADGADTEETP